MQEGQHHAVSEETPFPKPPYGTGSPSLSLSLTTPAIHCCHLCHCITLPLLAVAGDSIYSYVHCSRSPLHVRRHDIADRQPYKCVQGLLLVKAGIDTGHVSAMRLLTNTQWGLG